MANRDWSRPVAGVGVRLSVDLPLRGLSGLPDSLDARMYACLQKRRTARTGDNETGAARDGGSVYGRRGLEAASVKVVELHGRSCGESDVVSSARRNTENRKAETDLGEAVGRAGERAKGGDGVRARGRGASVSSARQPPLERPS